MVRSLIVIICVSSGLYSQWALKKENFTFRETKSADAGNTLIWSSILVLTPTLFIEDGRSHFALSKELSIGKFPYGRGELDYSYIFRSERTSALHLSYNLDIPLNGSFSAPSLFMLSPGAGYYTDFTRKGFFAQLAFGLWAGTGFAEGVSIHPNIKARKVFMSENLPDAFEVSLGVGFGIYSR
jgi:hypothetical protein